MPAVILIVFDLNLLGVKTLHYFELGKNKIFNANCYFGAFTKKYIPIVAKMMLGNHPAIKGEIIPEIANTRKNSMKMM